MLRLGLTGGLGSGKSTVAALLAARGAHLLSSDDLGRQLMQPGRPVFASIVDHFGPSVVLPSGQLNRPALAHLAFAEGRAEELNALVHPAVIAREAALAAELAARRPQAVLVVESALLFETTHAGPEGWRTRFDRILLVTAPEPLRLARFIERVLGPGPHTPAEHSAALRDAQSRVARQLSEAEKRPLADFILPNTGSLSELERAVDRLWPTLLALASHPSTPPSPSR